MKKVFVIDDMPMVCDQAENMMKDRYEVFVWDPDQDAVAQIREAKPDVVLLDLYLEDDVSGRILESLAGDPELSPIPVIVTAADASVLLIAKFYSMGASDFIRKPFVEHVLFRKLDSQIKLKEIGYRFEL